MNWVDNISLVMETWKTRKEYGFSQNKCFPMSRTNLNKCSHCGKIFEEDKESIDIIITHNTNSYKCKDCEQNRTNNTSSTATIRTALTIAISPPFSSSTSELLPLTRRVAKYERYYQTKKFVRNIKTLMIEAHIDKYHAF